MKIQYASDLHLEFPENRRLIKESPLEVCGDILILARDISLLYSLREADFFWSWCSKNYKETFIIPGNHEYYDGWDIKKGETFKLMLRHNVGYYANKCVRVEDTNIILSTLWSHVPVKAQSIVQALLHDFRCIVCENDLLTINNYNALHAQNLAFIKKAVQTSSAKNKIVVTHHLPSFKVVDPFYQDSATSHGFATNLDEWIKEASINYWIYGHSHSNINGQIGNTQLVSNQLGYVEFGEEDSFKRDAVLTV